MSLESFGDQLVGPEQLAIRMSKLMSGVAITISGMIVNVSGAIVEISGNLISTKTVSGDYVVVSGTIISQISGAIVTVSGEAVTISGNYTKDSIATVGRVRPLLQCAALSGGTVLASGDIKSITLQSISGNADMYMGFVTSGDQPYSGFGFLVAGGGVISMDIDNFNKVAVFATTSGQKISYFGNQY